MTDERQAHLRNRIGRRLRGYGDAADRLAAIAATHEARDETRNGMYCKECGHPYPCTTVKIIMGGAA